MTDYDILVNTYNDMAGIVAAMLSPITQQQGQRPNQQGQTPQQNGQIGGTWITSSVPIFVHSRNYYIPIYPAQQITLDFLEVVEEKKKDSEGCSCKKCENYYEYAEPNQDDGTLICWACRHGY